MVTVTTTFTIKSFRRADDPNFLRALDIYSRSVHHQAKTDTRDIVYWLEHGSAYAPTKLYICGLFEGAQVIGFLEFAYFPADRLVHIDYFVIAEEHRSRGRFHILAEQFVAFLTKEHLSYDLITAEIPLVDEASGRFGYSEKLIRLFRLTGMGELKVDYDQPMLCWENEDTAIAARLMVFSPVAATKLSVSRYLHLLEAIYLRHYRPWYQALYPEHDDQYRGHLEHLISKAGERLKGTRVLDIDFSDLDFAAPQPPPQSSSVVELIRFLVKLLVGMGAAAVLHWFLRMRTDWNAYVVLGVVGAAFAMIAVVLSLRNRGQIETVKFYLSLMRDFFSN